VSKTARITLCALPLFLAVLICAASLPNSLKYELAPFIRNLASGLFLTAGVLRMAAWRLTRDWATARSAIALLVLGTALPSTSVLRLMVHDGPVVNLEAPETRLLFALPIVVLAISGARHSRHLMRHTVAVMAAVGLTVPAAIALIATATPAGQHHLNLWLATETLAAAGWTALALQAWSQRHYANQSMLSWVTLGLALMASAEIFKAWSLGDAHAPHGISTYVQLMAALVAAAVALNGLWMSIRAEGVDSGDLTRALLDTQRRLAHIEERQRQRLHDARSAAMGVAGASQLLAMPNISSTVDPARLRALVANELDRLQGLLELDEAEPISEFDLADALDIVVLTHRVEGMSIDSRLRGLRVVGRPRTTATVLDNLLRNTRRHAPHASVQISARPLGDDVEIVVADNGPGIPAAERARVLLAGVRGSTAQGTGSGLGLYTAATTMAAQAGTLRLGVRRHGGTRVALTLPMAVANPYALVS
jgi:signal transduction histidine kinase